MITTNPKQLTIVFACVLGFLLSILGTVASWVCVLLQLSQLTSFVCLSCSLGYVNPFQAKREKEVFNRGFT